MPVFVSIVIFAATAARLSAQAPNPTSAANPFFGSVTARPATDEALKLSLDDAIALGLKNNLGLKEAEDERKVDPGPKETGLAGVPSHHHAHRRSRRPPAQSGRAGFRPRSHPDVCPALSRRGHASWALVHHPRRSDRGTASLPSDALFRPGHRRMEGRGRRRTRRPLCQNVGPRRGRPAGGLRLSARHRRLERSGQRQGPRSGGPGAARPRPRRA